MPMATGPNDRLRIIVFGAHPDDCEHRVGGTAALWARMGHMVKFVSLTNGDAGHHSEGGGPLAARRRAESAEAARRLGIAESIVLDTHDGELLPVLERRHRVIREIRKWNAGLVLAHRTTDYHPDHRYTGVLVQDAAFLVAVPNVCPDTPALRRNPVFMYYEDGFRRPVPFRPDVAVDITDAFELKMDALDAHVSQFYEWLPWLDGRLADVPRHVAERRRWLAANWGAEPAEAVRESLARWYGAERAARVRHAEAFELCEHGAQAGEAALRRLFPMIG